MGWCMFFHLVRLPEHHSPQSDGPFPVLQSSFSCQVYELLRTDELVVELWEKTRSHKGIIRRRGRGRI